MHYVWFQSNTGQVNISHSVNSNAHTTPVRIYDEPNAHQFCAVDIFLNITHRLEKITSCQVPSRIRTWFHDSAVYIDFNQSNIHHPIRINYFT